jgi:RNA polymerase sigma-70 factor, ECF subfamily
LLVAELRQGHVDALETLLREYGGEIQAVAYLTLRNEHDAEEVLADTLLTAWRKIGTLRDPDRLRPWLLTIATRLALRRRRRLQPRVVSLDPSAVLPSTAPVAFDELELRDAINRLPPRMRAVVALNVVADLPVAEVARVLGTSENTVKSQLRVARTRLRAALRAPSSSGGSPGAGASHE